LPGRRIRAAFTGMGAKYLPTKRDLKASERYFNNKHPLPHTRKSATALPKTKKTPAAAQVLSSAEPAIKSTQ
jgi:hypothetical protein